MKNLRLLTILLLSALLNTFNNSYIIAQEPEELSDQEQLEHITHIQPGTIILLNGTSSAGKSTLLYELAKNYYPTFHIARIDDFIRTPKGYNRKTRYQNFYTYIKEIAQSGKSVLVDTVSYQGDYEKYDAILKPCKVIKILVYCPLDVLIMHVKKRNESGIAREQRTINKAFWQFVTLYKIKNSPKDITIDHISSNQIKNAILKSQAMANHLSWFKAREQKKINKNINKDFNLKTSGEMDITSKHRWDFIVNTGINAPENIAQNIVNFVEAIFA